MLKSKAIALVIKLRNLAYSENTHEAEASALEAARLQAEHAISDTDVRRYRKV